MQHKNRCIVVALIIVGLQLAACAPKTPPPPKIEPAKVEPLEGGLHRVVLTEKAAERLDIQTAPVREEQVTRKRRVGGEVVADVAGVTTTTAPISGTISTPGHASVEGDDLSGVWVRVPLNESDLNKVAQGQSALVLLLDDEDEAEGWTAEAVDDPEDEDLEEETEALYYLVDSVEHGLVPGQIVLVELTLEGSGAQRLVVPYGAVIYDLHGETWVYTNPEPLVFVRHPIRVDYIEGDLAVLLEGPPAGTEVATVGVAELFGTEFGVGK
jgi:hypothetical protein